MTGGADLEVNLESPLQGAAVVGPEHAMEGPVPGLRLGAGGGQGGAGGEDQ